MTDKAKTRERTRYQRLDMLGGLDMLEARYHQQRFSRHVHETFCIGVIEEGAQRFYRSGAEHVAPKGDIILVNADDVHTGSSEMEGGWAYRAIYPHPDLFFALSRDMQSAAGTIPWFPDAVLHDPGLAQQLRMTFDLLVRQGDTLLKETLLLSSLTWLRLRHGKTRRPPRTVPCATTQIANVRQRMDSSPEQDFSLVELADMAGLSPWHFLRQFKAVAGIPPHVYLVQARLRKAKDMLLHGSPIAAVSMACGFTDQSHFSRHFKKSLGVTPGEFVRGIARQ